MTNTIRTTAGEAGTGVVTGAHVDAVLGNATAPYALRVYDLQTGDGVLVEGALDQIHALAAGVLRKVDAMRKATGQ